MRESSIPKSSMPSERESSVAHLTSLNVETIAKMEKAYDQERRWGERVADAVSRALGSWTFLIIQSSLLGLWVVLNVIASVRHWDPYPFILLNLALSFQAAYATPLIIMSQNRQTRISDRRNHLDLQINLLAEQETTAILKMLEALCVAQGVKVDLATNAKVFEETTCPETVVQQIRDAVETA